ncbi:hypothetical protein NUW54_g7380 [Trametes sanguinea]|uniref:Uncharacterized protein n=1 Tax=Trametes sanguinea TaxID=158606 RepID=A0ACC1PLZ6_9APHY|nr:hypothetical protein NUW54_g7380 [Trametes sanguinea]
MASRALHLPPRNPGLVLASHGDPSCRMEALSSHPPPLPLTHRSESQEISTGADAARSPDHLHIAISPVETRMKNIAEKAGRGDFCVHLALKRRARILQVGPGPPEPPLSNATSQDLLDTGSPAPPAQNGAASSAAVNLMATGSSSQETPEDGGEDDDAVPQAPTSDPYAALDSAFGGYLADEPRPQNKDLLDMI